MMTTKAGGSADISKSLQELEGEDWGDATGPTDLVVKCHRLRRKPLRDLDDDELRTAIGQGIGIRYLTPLALARLETDPLIHATFFPGDLLKAVLQKVPASYWEARADLRQKVDPIVARFFERAEKSQNAERPELEDDPFVGSCVIADIRAVYQAFSHAGRRPV